MPIEKQIPAAVFHAMGLLVGMAAAAEWKLADCILRLVSNGHSAFFHAYPLVVGTEAKVKITLIRTFLKMQRLDEDEAIGRLLDKISTSFDHRNEVAHSFMSTQKGRIYFQDLRAKPRLGGMPQRQVRTAKEIRGWARDLWRQMVKLEKALDGLWLMTAEERARLDQLMSEFETWRAQTQEAIQPHPTTDKKRQ
jgi:hypothetical protein